MHLKEPKSLRFLASQERLTTQVLCQLMADDPHLRHARGSNASVRDPGFDSGRSSQAPNCTHRMLSVPA
jgi:hypothetical protein